MAELRPVSEIVMLGVPAVVSWKKKLPTPLLIATDVIVPSNGPVLKTSNRVVPEDDVRLAVPLYVVTRLAVESCTSKFTTTEGIPATTVWAALVITN